MITSETLFIHGVISLTPNQKKVVEYIIENAEDVTYMSTNQMADAVGVSNATIVRLAQSLGFEGYSHLQQHLRTHIKGHQKGSSRLKSVDHIKSLDDVLTSVMQKDIANLQIATATTSTDTFKSVVKELQTRKEIHILGLRSVQSLAQYLGNNLRLIGKRVFMVTPGIGDLWLQLDEIDNQSILVAFTFPRYMKLNMEVAKFFKERNATVIAITDSLLSPLAVHSDYILPCPFWIDSYFESYVAAMSLLNAILTGIVFLDGEKASAELRRKERLWEEKKIYYLTDKQARPSWLDK